MKATASIEDSVPDRGCAGFYRKNSQRIYVQRATYAHRSVYHAIIMEAMRNSWTDERLDDGFDRVEEGLRSTRAEVGSFRVETNERFDRVEDRLTRVEGAIKGLDGRFGGLEGRFEGLEKRFDGFESRFDRFEDRFAQWQRTQFIIGGGIIAALMSIVATQI